MKRFTLFCLVIIFAVTFLAAPLYAQDVYKTWRPANTDPNGEKFLWDALVMRPAGLITCVLGIRGIYCCTAICTYFKDSRPGL